MTQIEYLTHLGVDNTDGENLLRAMGTKDQSQIDIAIYSMVTGWDTYHYGPDVSEIDFVRLMEFTRTGLVD